MGRDLMGLFINTLGSIIFLPIAQIQISAFQKIHFLAQILVRIDLDGAERPVKVAFLLADKNRSIQLSIFNAPLDYGIVL